MSASAGGDGPLLSSEQEHLIETLAQAFGDLTRKVAAQGLEPAYSDEQWAVLAHDLGLLGVDLPERYGGSGFTVTELGLTMREMGKVLLPSPFLSTVVLGAGVLLAQADEQARQELLPRITDGTLTLAVAMDVVRQGFDTGNTQATATRAADGRWEVSGEYPLVLDADSAGLLIVAARAAEGFGLFLVDPAASGVFREAVPCLDASRPGSTLRLKGAPARPLGELNANELALDRVRDRLLVALACENVGAAKACLELAVEYATARHQFGRPIGSFQAIKHRCVDVHLEITTADSMALRALDLLARGMPEASAACGMAAAAGADALSHAAAANVQVHGGIGITWEHPAHRYYRRAVTARTLFGSPRSHRLLAYEQLGNHGSPRLIGLLSSGRAFRGAPSLVATSGR
jgi:alkylation response protein AidB-like acyl-CoA dehydrogenase